MNTVIILLLIILCLTTYLKWIILIVLSPVLIIYNKHKYNQACCLDTNDISDHFSMEIPPTDKHTQKKNKKFKLNRYLEGYLRYMQFQIANLPSHHVRNFIYRKIYLIKLAPTAVIYFGSEIRGGYFLSIKNGAIIGDNAIIDARRGGIEIGENVQLGSNVKLWTGSHDYDDPMFRSTPQKRGPIKIGDRAWLGPDVTVLHSVTIGEGAVIAAGAVVTKNVESFAIMGGIPAKKIGERSHDLKYTFTGDHIPFY